MKLKRFYLLFLVFYVVYATGISLYLFNLEPGFVPEQYRGTAADPATFMSQEEIQEAHHLSLVKNISFFLLLPFDFLVLIVVMAFSTKLRNKAREVAKRSFWRVGYYYFIFSLIMLLLYLPLDLFLYHLDIKYNLSDQPLLSWLKDLGSAFAVDVVLSTLLLWLFYFIVKKQPKKWWLTVSLISLPINLSLMFIIPTLIMPLFNEYKPLENKAVKAEIQKLAEQAGVSDAKIEEMNMSKQSNGINAFVVGIGGQTKIVLGDTTLKELTVEEIKFIMAHEIGHYKLKHIYSGVVVSFIVSFLISYLVYVIYNFFIRKWGHIWGIENQEDIAAMPLLILAIAITTFPISPVTNTIIRIQEKQADRYAIELTQNKEAAISAFQKTNKNYKETGYSPDFIHYLLDDHPRVTERITDIEKYKIKK